MCDKEFIQYILDNNLLKNNAHYVNIINTLGYEPIINSINIKQKNKYILINLVYRINFEDYGSFKNALWFGKIEMNVYNAKVEEPITITAIIKIDKNLFRSSKKFEDIEMQKTDIYQADIKGNELLGMQTKSVCKEKMSSNIIHNDYGGKEV